MASRGIRNNNPGNIEYGPFARSMGATGSDGRFAIFPTPQSGIAAIAALQQRYENRGLNTVQERINRWAPAFENNVSSYANAVAGGMGIGANDPFSFVDPNLDDDARFISAMIQHENGSQPYSLDQIRGALTNGTIQRPTSAAKAAAAASGLQGYLPPSAVPAPRLRPSPLVPDPSLLAGLPQNNYQAFFSPSTASRNIVLPKLPHKDIPQTPLSKILDPTQRPLPRPVWDGGPIPSEINPDAASAMTNRVMNNDPYQGWGKPSLAIAGMAPTPPQTIPPTPKTQRNAGLFQSAISTLVSGNPSAVNKVWWGDQTAGEKAMGTPHAGSLFNVLKDAQAQSDFRGFIVNIARDNPLAGRQIAQKIVQLAQQNSPAWGEIPGLVQQALLKPLQAVAALPLTAVDARREASGLQGYDAAPTVFRQPSVSPQSVVSLSHPVSIPAPAKNYATGISQYRPMVASSPPSNLPATTLSRPFTQPARPRPATPAMIPPRTTYGQPTSYSSPRPLAPAVAPIKPSVDTRMALDRTAMFNPSAPPPAPPPSASGFGSALPQSGAGLRYPTMNAENMAAALYGAPSMTPAQMAAGLYGTTAKVAPQIRVPPAITVRPNRQTASSTALPRMIAPTNLVNGPTSAAARGGQPYYGGSNGGPAGPTWTGTSPTKSGGPNYSYSISPNGKTVSWTNSSGTTFTALRNV